MCKGTCGRHNGSVDFFENIIYVWHCKLDVIGFCVYNTNFILKQSLSTFLPFLKNIK